MNIYRTINPLLTRIAPHNPYPAPLNPTVKYGKREGMKYDTKSLDQHYTRFLFERVDVKRGHHILRIAYLVHPTANERYLENF